MSGSDFYDAIIGAVGTASNPLTGTITGSNTTGGASSGSAADNSFGLSPYVQSVINNTAGLPAGTQTAMTPSADAPNAVAQLGPWQIGANGQWINQAQPAANNFSYVSYQATPVQQMTVPTQTRVAIPATTSASPSLSNLYLLNGLNGVQPAPLIQPVAQPLPTGLPWAAPTNPHNMPISGNTVAPLWNLPTTSNVGPSSGGMLGQQAPAMGGQAMPMSAGSELPMLAQAQAMGGMPQGQQAPMTAGQQAVQHMFPGYSPFQLSAQMQGGGTPGQMSDTVPTPTAGASDVGPTIFDKRSWVDPSSFSKPSEQGQEELTVPPAPGRSIPMTPGRGLPWTPQQREDIQDAVDRFMPKIGPGQVPVKTSDILPPGETGSKLAEEDKKAQADADKEKTDIAVRTEPTPELQARLHADPETPAYELPQKLDAEPLEAARAQARQDIADRDAARYAAGAKWAYKHFIDPNTRDPLRGAAAYLPPAPAYPHFPDRQWEDKDGVHILKGAPYTNPADIQQACLDKAAAATLYENRHLPPDVLRRWEDIHVTHKGNTREPLLRGNRPDFERLLLYLDSRADFHYSQNLSACQEAIKLANEQAKDEPKDRQEAFKDREDLAAKAEARAVQARQENKNAQSLAKAYKKALTDDVDDRLTAKQNANKAVGAATRGDARNITAADRLAETTRKDTAALANRRRQLSIMQGNQDIARDREGRLTTAAARQERRQQIIDQYRANGDIRARDRALRQEGMVSLTKEEMQAKIDYYKRGGQVTQAGGSAPNPLVPSAKAPSQGVTAKTDDDISREFPTMPPEQRDNLLKALKRLYPESYK